MSDDKPRAEVPTPPTEAAVPGLSGETEHRVPTPATRTPVTGIPLVEPVAPPKMLAKAWTAPPLPELMRPVKPDP
jgi:hypothetical protein